MNEGRFNASKFIKEGKEINYNDSENVVEKFRNPTIIGYVLVKNEPDFILYNDDGNYSALAVEKIFSNNGELNFERLSENKKFQQYDKVPSEENVYVSSTSNEGGSSKLYGGNIIRYVKLVPGDNKIEKYDIEDATREDYDNMNNLFTKAVKFSETDVKFFENK